MKQLLLAIGLIASLLVKAQNDSVLIFKGATLHIGNGTVIENGLIRVEKGKITYAGKDDPSISVANAKVMQLTGKHIYPGLIAPNTILGLTEIEAVRATQDNAEVGYYNPNVRSVIAYNTDSKIIPTIRSNGILLAEVAPVSGVIPGTSSVMKLDGWNWEDAAYKKDIAIHLNWPSIYRATGWWAEPGPIELNKNYDKVVEEIKSFFAEAKAYAGQPANKTLNLKLEAVKGLFDKSKKLFVHVNSAREIMAVIDFNKTYQFPLVIVGGEETAQVADLLKANKVQVVLYNLHSLPATMEEAIDMPFTTPSLLKQAGVEFCLSIGGSWQVRNLPFVAGTAAAYGLGKEEALAAITSSTANILGIADSVGTLQAGKDATLIVSSGDLLDMKTSNVEFAYIRGKQVDLDNQQKQLARKFQDKYKRGQ
ncbi:MAG: amidohydrolase family protein [Chitinophagales bacterium]|nr:amidohydrolase family protein [Chitinophagales bacterium]